MDCNDDDRLTFPGATEICDGVDNDCDGSADDASWCAAACGSPEVIGPIVNVSQSTTRASDARLVWTRDGWVIAYDSESSIGAACSEVWLTKVSPLGAISGGPVRVAGATPTVPSKPAVPSLTWTGAQLGVAWQEGVLSDCGAGETDDDVRFQRFNSALQPIGTLLNVPGCPASNIAGGPVVQWGRSRFALTWFDKALPLRASTVDRDDHIADPCGIPVTGTNSANSMSIAWNGTYFGLGWAGGAPEADWINIFGDYYFRRYGEDGSLPDPEPIRETTDPARSEWSSLVWADGEWGAAWADTRASALNFYEIFLARLSTAGEKRTPPGDLRVTCCNTNTSGEPRRRNRIAWTGQEYALAYEDLNNAAFGNTLGDIFLQRLDRAGSKLGGPLLVSSDSQKFAQHPDLAWNGKEFGVAWDDLRVGSSVRQVYFARVGCNCADLDHDGFSSCAGKDCDDTNPQVNLSRPELCTNGLDDNCDALVDCQDTARCPAAGGTGPVEVGGVRWETDRTTLFWTAEVSSSSYDVLHGDVLLLIQDGNFDTATCAAWRNAATNLVVTELPPKGRATYYLVRGKADSCRLGTWGSALRDQARLKCP